MPNSWILVPGYGAQGGGAKDVAPAFDKTVLSHRQRIPKPHARLPADRKDQLTHEEFAEAARAEAKDADDILRRCKNPTFNLHSGNC